MARDFDVEDLKVNKIAPAPKDRRRLPLLQAEAKPRDETPQEVQREGSSHRLAPKSEVEESVIEALREIYDPEIPVNVYDLGLIYELLVDDAGDVEVRMTLTAPGCPVAGEIVRDVAKAVSEVETVRMARVSLVWDPPWTKARMTDDALLELGLL